MASSTSQSLVLILLGLIVAANGSADAIASPLFPSEQIANPVGNITDDHLKDLVPPVTEHPVIGDHATSTEGPKTTPTGTRTPTDHLSTSIVTENPLVKDHSVTTDHLATAIVTENPLVKDHSVTTDRPTLVPVTTEHSVRGAEGHSVPPPTTESPIITTPATPIDKSGEHVIVHTLSVTDTKLVPDQPLPSHILDKLQEHHDNIVTAQSHTPPPDVLPVTVSPIIFPQHTPQGPVTLPPPAPVTSTTAAPSKSPTTVTESPPLPVTTSPAIVSAPTVTSAPPQTFSPTTHTSKVNSLPIVAPLFPPVQPNPLAMFGNIYTGIVGATSAFINSLPNPFKRESEPPAPSNPFLNGVSLAMATPFVFIGAKLGAPLIIISSTLAIPVVKAGGYFAIPFIKGKNEKDSVPLFVVTDSVNSFSMQIDAPDIKPTIEAGQLIIVARTPATEKLLEPLLNALKGVNPGVQEQTIILQPVLKAQTLDNNATPSDLAQVVRDVRKILNLQTLSDQVTDAVENIKLTVSKARDSVHQTIKSGLTNIFGSESDDSTNRRRASQSGVQKASNTEDDSVPIIWVTPTPDSKPQTPPVVTPQPNIPLVEEVHYENGAPLRNKRDVSDYPESMEVIEAWTKRPITKKPYVHQSTTVASVKYSHTAKPAAYYRKEDQVHSAVDIAPERLLECSAVLTEMSTTECHRIENYSLKSCRTDLLYCKNVAQQDLTRLMGLCNKPEADFMCSMKSREQREAEVVDGKATSKVCQVYNFKIVRIFNTKSSLCNDQLKCVFGKQFGCHTKS